MKMGLKSPWIYGNGNNRPNIIPAHVDITSVYNHWHFAKVSESEVSLQYMGKKCESVIQPLSSLRFAAKLRLCVEVLYFVLRQSRIGNNRVPSHAYLLSIGCNRLSLVATHMMQPPAFAWTLGRICDFCSVLSDIYTVSQKLLNRFIFDRVIQKIKRSTLLGHRVYH